MRPRTTVVKSATAAGRAGERVAILTSRALKTSMLETAANRSDAPGVTKTGALARRPDTRATGPQAEVITCGQLHEQKT